MSIKNVEYSPKYPYKIVKKLLKATQKHNIFVEKQVKNDQKRFKKAIYYRRSWNGIYAISDAYRTQVVKPLFSDFQWICELLDHI